MEGHRMGTGVQELKHAAKVQEWSARVAECRSSGIGVKAWCREHGIALKTYYNWERQIVKEATQQYALAAPAPAGMLVQVNPDAMASDDVNAIETTVTIRHGESVITLPAGSSAGVIADLVKALNRHA
jgi:transposase-like protein